MSRKTNKKSGGIIGKIIGVLVVLALILAFIRDYPIIALIIVVLIIAAVVLVISKKKKPEHAKQAAPRQVSAQQTSVEVTEEKKKIKTINVPNHIKGQPIAYNYQLEFVPENGIDILNDIVKGEQRQVSLTTDGNIIGVVYENAVIGKVFDTSKAEMLADFMRKGEPVFSKLAGDENHVYIFFYRDKRKNQEWREKTVCKVTPPKKADNELYSPEDVDLICEGDEILYEIETDDNFEDIVFLYSGPFMIGYLPKKITAKVIENKPYGIFADHVEENRLFVTIYW